MVTKVVINTTYGGFGISNEALARYNEITGKNVEYHWYIERDDPALVQVVEEFDETVNDWCSNLKIVEIPDGVEWQIEEYDGSEWIAEKHRIWR
jgi:hypothetical protein